MYSELFPLLWIVIQLGMMQHKQMSHNLGRQWFQSKLSTANKYLEQCLMEWKLTLMGKKQYKKSSQSSIRKSRPNKLNIIYISLDLFLEWQLLILQNKHLYKLKNLLLESELLQSRIGISFIQLK